MGTLTSVRAWMFVIGVLAFATEAAAQRTLENCIRSAPPPHHAGVLHLASGTWTRKATSASIGGDVIYNNTCSTGQHFNELSDNTYVTQGRIPSPTGPTGIDARPGCATSYLVDGFEIAYCTDQLQANVGTYSVAFYTSYTPCTSVIGLTPTAAFDLNGSPGTSVAGTVACWIVTIDLGASPPPAFTLLADGDGTYAGTSLQNLFGWSMSNTPAPGHPYAMTGPLIAGDFNTCSGFDGTRWDSVVNYAESGTGMGSLAQFRIEGGNYFPGCYSITPLDPFFYLKLHANACSDGFETGTAYCAGDGSGTSCPCANSSPAVQRAGCRNSLGLAASLRANGTAEIAHDSLSLRAHDCPPTSTALFFQGTSRTASGAGAVFGDGLRCASGTVVRLGVKTNDASGSSTYPGPGDASVSVRGMIPSAVVRDYQLWYRNAAAFCTAATFNLSNGWEIAWAL